MFVTGYIEDFPLDFVNGSEKVSSSQFKNPVQDHEKDLLCCAWIVCKSGCSFSSFKLDKIYSIQTYFLMRSKISTPEVQPCSSLAVVLHLSRWKQILLVYQSYMRMSTWQPDVKLIQATLSMREGKKGIRHFPSGGTVFVRLHRTKLKIKNITTEHKSTG